MPEKNEQANEEEAVFRIPFDGVEYDIRYGDFNALEELEYDKVTGGHSLVEVFAEGKVTLFSVAGMIYLHRKRHEPNLTFEEIASKVTLETLSEVKQAVDEELGEPEGEDAPND